MHHETVIIEEWIARFPLDKFEKKDGARQFDTTPKDDPLDLWKASGPIILGPEGLAVLEQVRRRVGRTFALGRAVPTDIFLWGTGEPSKPYLTKIGGVPYRPANAPWPQCPDGPMTFFAQYCFLDSHDLFRRDLPGDIMLVFLKSEESLYDPPSVDECLIEWHKFPLSRIAKQTPSPGFQVPALYGVRYRTADYPKSEECFRQAGHYQYWLFATSQATRIGGGTWVIQKSKPWNPKDKLVCTLSYVSLYQREWPFVNVKSLEDIKTEEREKYEIPLGDAGCLYFAMSPGGVTTCYVDSY